jgi:hypothetical protein
MTAGSREDHCRSPAVGTMTGGQTAQVVEHLAVVVPDGEDRRLPGRLTTIRNQPLITMPKCTDPEAKGPPVVRSLHPHPPRPQATQDGERRGRGR